MSESALFVYGSLMLPTRRTQVLGRSASAIGARLLDHERKLLRGTPYPAARSRPGATVHGELVSGITSLELARLDAYEGDLYRRTLVNVETGSGIRRAFVYVIAPAFERRLSDADWSFDEFCRRGTG